jgi:hypothetical protein
MAKFLLLISLLFFRVGIVHCFASLKSAETSSLQTKMSATTTEGEHPFCQLPGDPSLILTTNVDLGDKKMEIMKGEKM